MDEVGSHSNLFKSTVELIKEWRESVDNKDSHINDSLHYASVDGLGQEKIYEQSVKEFQSMEQEAVEHCEGKTWDTDTKIVSGASFELECKREYHKQQTLDKYYSLMSEEENIEVNLEGEQKVLTIRRGVAPEPNNPAPVSIKGHIDAPYRYYKKRAGKTFAKEDAHLEVDTQNKKIRLYVDPSDDLAPTVTGSIKRYAPLMKLQINEGKAFGKDDFKLLMKQHRFLFKNSSDCSELVSKLENLELQVDQSLKDKDDSRGNRSLVVKQTVESELPETITLESQIFVEGDEQEIVADLCYDVNSSGTLKLWLESSTLYEMVEEQTRQMISETVTDFDDEIVIIYQ